MKYQHTSILTTLVCFGLFLLGGIDNFAFAAGNKTTPTTQTPRTPELEQPKISFAKVTDSGTSPQKTASCMIAWPVANGGNATPNIFCVYGEDKDNVLKFRDNDEVGKILREKDSTLPAVDNKDKMSESVTSWLKNNSFNELAQKAIPKYFLEYVKGDPTVEDIEKYLKDTNTPTVSLSLADNCDNYKLFAPITYQAFALFVHDLIQNPTSPSLIKNFCDSNPATALVFLDARILPLLQNPEMVKLLNNKDAWSRLDSIKDKPNLLAVLNPDIKENPNFPKILEILGKPEVIAQLGKDNVVSFFGNPEMVKVLGDPKFSERIDEAIKKYSEIKTLLDATQKLLEEAKTKLSPEPLKKSIVDGVSNTFAQRLTPLEDEIKAVATHLKSTPASETFPKSSLVSEILSGLKPVLIISSLAVAVLLMFFWIYEHFQWKDALFDDASIIRSEFVELHKAQRAQSEFNSKLKNTPEQIKRILSLLANQKTTPEGPPSLTGGEETGIGDSVSEIQRLVKDAIRDVVAQYQPPQSQLVAAEQTLLAEVSEKVTALIHYQTQQQSLAATQKMFALGMLEQISLFKMALTNYQLEKQYLGITDHLSLLHQQSQDILSRLPAESLWPVLEKSSQTISQVANDLQTLLTVPVTLNGLTQSLVATREELKTALTTSQNQMVHSLKPLNEKVAEIDKLLRSKKLWEEVVLTPVKGLFTESQIQMTQSLKLLDEKMVGIDRLLNSKELWEAAVLKPVKELIATTLDFHKKFEAEKDQRVVMERDFDALLTALNKRFGFLKFDRTNVSKMATSWATPSMTWSWSQAPLWKNLDICRDLLQQLQQREVATDIQEILTLLFEKDQQFFTPHWETLTSQNFDSQTKIWNFLRTLDGGKWLNRVFRATDLLQTYFTDKPQLRELTQRLATTKGLLTLVLTEMGIGLRQPPKLLENVPNDIPDKSRNYVPSPLLKKLVKSKVVEKAKTAPHLVVDIVAYGFITPENSQPEIQVVVFSQAEW